jgi:hypothetical protein
MIRIIWNGDDLLFGGFELESLVKRAKALPHKKMFWFLVRSLMNSIPGRKPQDHADFFLKMLYGCEEEDVLDNKKLHKDYMLRLRRVMKLIDSAPDIPLEQVRMVIKKYPPKTRAWYHATLDVLTSGLCVQDFVLAQDSCYDDEVTPEDGINFFLDCSHPVDQSAIEYYDERINNGTWIPPRAVVNQKDWWNFDASVYTNYWKAMGTVFSW